MVNLPAYGSTATDGMGCIIMHCNIAVRTDGTTYVPTLPECEEAFQAHQQSFLHYECTMKDVRSLYEAELAERCAGRPNLLDPTTRLLGRSHLPVWLPEHDLHNTASHCTPSAS